MAFDPSQPFDVVSAPAPVAGGFDPSRPFDVVPSVPAEEPGRLEALGRGAIQGATLGFGDELGGAIHSLLSGFRDGEYAKRRDEIRANNEAARSAHGGYYLGGELAGGIAGAVAPAGLLAKGAALAGEGSALARGLGGAAKVAELATGSGGASTAGVAARSAIGGAVAGLGASDADTLSGAAKDTGLGALTGGIVGGALHGVGSKIAGKAEQRAERGVNADVFKNARPKDFNSAMEVQKANPEAFKEMVNAPDFQSVRKLARSGKTEEAIDAVEKFTTKAGENRLGNYAAAAKNYKTEPGPVLDRMEKLAAYKNATGAKEEAKAISEAARDIRGQFSTIDTTLIKEGDAAHDLALAKLKPYLPERPTLTKSEFQEAATKLAKAADPHANYGDVTDDVHAAIESLPFTFDPKASISLVQLRKAATSAQNATKATLGSIAETEHYRIVRSVDDAINDSLDAHLTAAAKTSPAAAKVVEAIRHDNKLISMSLAMKDGLEARLKKESGFKGETLAEKGIKGAKSIGHMVGLAGAMTHNPALAAVAVLPHALTGAHAVARMTNDKLARYLYAARNGNEFAKKVIEQARQVPGIAARLASLEGVQ